MANQAIALGARAPQANILGGSIQRNAQMMNMMAQQAAAQRQAAQASQAMQFAQNEETRKAALAVPQLSKAEAEAFSANMKAADDFLNLTIEGMKLARNPEDAVKIGSWLKSQFPQPQFQQAVDQSLSSLPQDASQFEDWRKQTMYQSMESKDQLEQHFNDVTTGRESWTTAAPKYAGAPMGNAAREVPGSRVQAAEDITYIKGPNNEIIPMPKTLPGTGGPVGTGLVAGDRGGGSAAAALQTNPGALKDGAFARSQPGYTGSSGGFATFDTPEAGIRAQENLLRTAYVGKGFNTIDKIVNRYAPQGPENSAASVSNYKKYIADRTGININAPITADQIPAVAAAMREFETGNRPGAKGGAGGIELGKPIAGTTEQGSREKAFRKALDIAGYDINTGKDRVSDLINASTSGPAEMLASEAAGLFGKATPGRVALSELRAIADNMTFEKLRGKLGAQISDADVRLIANTMADIANGNTPANARSAAWKNIVLPLLLRDAGVKPPAKTARGGNSNRPAPTPADVQAVRRNRNSKEWTEGFRRQFGDEALRKALGGR